MIFNGPHECPNCKRFCNVEDYAEREAGDRLVTLLYCDHCTCGYETLFIRAGVFWKFRWTSTYTTKRPRLLTAFARRLEDARRKKPELAVPA